MKNFNNNDDEDFNGEFGDDFYGRWEEFNRMMNSEKNKRDMNRFHRDLEELMKLMGKTREGGTPIRFNFLPLNDENRNDLNIPNGEMNIESGEDENGKWETKEWTSPNGGLSFLSFTRSSTPEDELNSLDEMAEEWKMKLRNRDTKRTNPEEARNIKLAKLNHSLKYLVEQEKYEKAAEIKKLIDELNEDKTKEENN